MKSTSMIIIPARLESSRLPRKLLLAETGKPLIRHTYEAAMRSVLCEQPIVATDSPEIYEAVVEFNGLVMQTGDHPNGTARMAWAAGSFPGVDIFCNVQGDEPEISGVLIDRVIASLDNHPDWDCATAAVQQLSGVGVRVWMDAADIAWHFTRKLNDFPPQSAHYNPGRHIGIYAYRATALARYLAFGVSREEQAESLEQCRALALGLRMGVVFADSAPQGIDTRADYEAFKERQRVRSQT